jgi:HupE / UreJ protein
VPSSNPAPHETALAISVGLFGKTDAQRTLRLTVTRGSQKQLLVLTPDQPRRALLPSGWSVFADDLVLGAEHIVAGFDHLLFLLVVLSAGAGWRAALLALTTFTAGHAVTLVLSVMGGLTVPASIVEPTIAATIVGMAVFDVQVRRRQLAPSQRLRLALVFACALVHGLGLGAALTQLGLDGGHRLTSLAGFNAGIELAQVALALVVAAAAWGVRRLHGAIGLDLATQLASFSAVVVGSIWFVQRVIDLA